MKVYYTGKLTPSSGSGSDDGSSSGENGLEVSESDMLALTDKYGYKVYLGDEVVSELAIS